MIPKDVMKSEQDNKKSKKIKKEKKNSKKKVKESSESVEESVTANGVHSELDNEEKLTPEQKAGQFSNFKISEETIEKLKEKGVNHLFPIQAKTFNFVYKGEDVIAQARTGTGKTLSFALPLIEKLQKKEKNLKRGRSPKVLVMAPTRELAKQVSEDFEKIGNQSVACIYGGTPYGPQMNAIRAGIDVVVGTPGRLWDHIEKGNLDFSSLKHVVLDEVDMMLDMGFAEIVDKILETAYKRDDEKKPQTLLFSATLPEWVHETAKKYMKDDVKKVNLVGRQENRTSTTVQHLAIRSSYHDRASTIGAVIQVYSGSHGRCMIFCQTKKDADELAVSPSIKQDAHVLHGDIPQEKREMVLKGFRDCKYKVLITTDVAARGLDIPEVDLVIQCNPPKDVDSYIHRSGRTGRAGRSGVCICFYKPQEERDLQWVEKKAQIKFKKVGSPTTEEIIKSSASDAARSLENVQEETLQHFRESAESIIAERGAVDALAAALALISGSTKIVSRSLLSSKEGYTTYIFNTNIEMRTMSFAWRSLEKQIPMEIKEKISGMKFTKDRMGCVFDVPSEHDEEISASWQDGRYDSLQKATELPDLQEMSNGFGGSPRGRDSWGRGGGRGNFSGGRGSFSGGRGNFSGGRGSFSRGRGGSGGGFRGNRGGGMKRQSHFGGDSEPQNKKIKFD